jgi:hypothetical protein
MRCLSSELPAAGWHPSEMDNWRDCGWSVLCHRGSSELVVVVFWIQRGYWILQGSPRRVPGLIRGWIGSKPSATSNGVQELPLAVHHALSILQYFGYSQWRWDGFQDETHSTTEPKIA